MIPGRDNDCGGSSRRQSDNSFADSDSAEMSSACLARMPPSTSRRSPPCRHSLAHRDTSDLPPLRMPATAAAEAALLSGKPISARLPSGSFPTTDQDCKRRSSLLRVSMKRALPSLALWALLLLSCFPAGDARTQVVDWSPTSPIFHSDKWKITTKFARIYDSLQFHCPPVLSVSIYVVSEEQARTCRLPAETDRAKNLVGYCGPDTGQPKMVIRSVNPMPNRPVFYEDHDYYFITTSNGTAEGIDNAEGGLCATRSMRLKVHVQSKTAPPYSTDLVSDLMSDGVGLDPLPVPDVAHSQRTIINKHPNENGGRLKPSRADKIPGFPAMVTLDESGHKRRVIVNSYQELTEEINKARERNSPSQISLQVHPLPDMPMQVMSAFDPEIMTRYEVFGTGGAFERPFITKAEKRTRRPLDYEIGYDDDNGSIGTVPSVILLLVSSLLVVLLQRQLY